MSQVEATCIDYKRMDGDYIGGKIEFTFSVKLKSEDLDYIRGGEVYVIKNPDEVKFSQGFYDQLDFVSYLGYLGFHQEIRFNEGRSSLVAVERTSVVPMTEEEFGTAKFLIYPRFYKMKNQNDEVELEGIGDWWREDLSDEKFFEINEGPDPAPVRSGPPIKDNYFRAPNTRQGR